MWKYIVKRLVYLIPTLFGITILTFAIMRLIPGDPVEIILGQRTTAELVEIFEKQLGLDKPIYVQYLIWLRNILTGNLGKSLISNMEVSYLIFKRFHYTVRLAILTTAVNSSLGLFTGIISAYKAGGKVDKALRFWNIFGWSMPSFLVGIVLMYVFAVRLRLLPALGYGSIAHLIMPTMAIAFGGSSYLSRLTRGSLIEIAGQDFVKTAKAKGLTRRKIMVSHVMRNGLLPIVTVLAGSFRGALGGSFIIETIFSYPGIGYLATQSVSRRDYAVVQGSVLFFATLTCLTNLIVDILYVYLDPRVRYERR